jgi:GYF domain 2
MTDSAWYYADNGRVAGPFTLQDLQATLADVPDWKDMPVWRAGFSGWQAGSFRFVYADINGKPVTTIDLVVSDCP